MSHQCSSHSSSTVFYFCLSPQWRSAVERIRYPSNVLPFKSKRNCIFLFYVVQRSKENKWEVTKGISLCLNVRNTYTALAALPGRVVQSVGHLTRYPVWQHTFVSPSSFSRRAVVSYWRKYVHEVLVNHLGGISLPRKSVVN